MKILFVCNANVVRSFMAERVMENRLQRKGVHGVAVSSAGLLDRHGAPADRVATQILQENGVEADHHRSRCLSEAMISEADLIVPMELKQLQTIGERYPSAMNKLKLLRSYLPGSDINSKDIKDPYNRSVFHYRLCFAEITLAVEELMKCI